MGGGEGRGGGGGGGGVGEAEIKFLQVSTLKIIIDAGRIFFMMLGTKTRDFYFLGDNS